MKVSKIVVGNGEVSFLNNGNIVSYAKDGRKFYEKVEGKEYFYHCNFDFETIETINWEDFNNGNVHLYLSGGGRVVSFHFSNFVEHNIYSMEHIQGCKVYEETSEKENVEEKTWCEKCKTEYKDYVKKNEIDQEKYERFMSEYILCSVKKGEKECRIKNSYLEILFGENDIFEKLEKKLRKDGFEVYIAGNFCTISGWAE